MAPTIRQLPSWLLAVATIALVAPVGAVELGGHEIAPRVELAGRPLTLNGAGIRQKFIFNVYVCALYVEQPSHDARALLDGDRAWQLTMHFMRNVGHHQLLEAFTEALEHNNPPGELDRLRGDLERFHAVLNDLRKGDDLWIAYVPERGTLLHTPSGAEALVPGKRFADALLRTWIGDHPSDEGLKAHLLGL